MEATPNATGAASATNAGNGSMMPSVNDVAASNATPSDDPKQNLNQVINSIQKTLGLLHQLYLTVSSFNVASQLPLLKRLNSLVVELDNMSKMAEKCNIQVPVEVLNLIDDGKNPDEFTRDVINGCITKNQITKGKTDALKVYASTSLKNWKKLFRMKLSHTGRYVHYLLLCALYYPTTCWPS